MINIPTFSQLYTEIKSDIETELGTIPNFAKAFLPAIIGAWAGALKLVYVTLGRVQKNVWVDTAESYQLERFGLLYLNRTRFAARAAQYVVEVNGTVGAVIPAETTFKSDDDSLNPGKIYVLDTAYTLVSGTNTITIRALEGGLDSQLDVADTLTATAPLNGVTDQVTVDSASVEPAAAETETLYRQRIIAAAQLEPQGGAGSDYRLWAADAQGVQEVYPYAVSGESGQIDVYVEATIADSTDGKGTPSAALLSDVEDVIEFDPDTSKPLDERGRRPLGTNQIFVQAITPLDVDVVINSYSGLTPAIETLIEDSITNGVNQVRPYVASVDLPENENQGVLDVNRINNFIFEATPGAVYGTVTLSVDGTSTNSYTFSDGNIPYVNSITFV